MIHRNHDSCRSRIADALKWNEKTPRQLSDDLFVSQKDITFHLKTMLSSGDLFRRFFHNPRTGRPDYLYSSVKYPPKYERSDANHSVVVDLVGNWDVSEFWKWRKKI